MLQRCTIRSNFDCLDVCMHDGVSSPRLHTELVIRTIKIGYIKNHPWCFPSTYNHMKFMPLKKPFAGQ